MNTDELIERIHAANATRRKSEHRKSVAVWRWAVPAAVAAAAVLLVVLPRGNSAQAAAPTPGIYCNSQCNPDDVMTLIENNINHIKAIQVS